jgi:hypothetical protein
VGVSTSWNSQGLFRPVMGLLYLYRCIFIVPHDLESANLPLCIVILINYITVHGFQMFNLLYRIVILLCMDFPWNVSPLCSHSQSSSSPLKISLCVVLNYVAHILGIQTKLFHLFPVFNRRTFQLTNCHFLISTKNFHKIFMSTDKHNYRFVCLRISDFNGKKYIYEQCHLRPKIMLFDFFQHQDLQLNHSYFLVSHLG